MTARLPDDPSVSTSAAAGSPPWRPVAHWRELLVGRRPEDILERIMADDPLRLRALAARTIRATSRFVDADRVVLRSFARIAHRVTVEGAPRARTDIEREVARAIEDVLADERAAVRGTGHGTGGAPASEDSGPFTVLARPLGLSGSALRRACDAFNRRPPDEREAFFVLVVDAREIDDAARALESNPTDVARRARRALEALLDAAGAGGDG